ncbi:unnamed protein product [Amoebophrya sp. A120]|nr:unnamed protein product [Amoebophrya sp. A120]|eukprot:GSA120T00005278001.1
MKAVFSTSAAALLCLAPGSVTSRLLAPKGASSSQKRAVSHPAPSAVDRSASSGASAADDEFQGLRDRFSMISKSTSNSSSTNSVPDALSSIRPAAFVPEQVGKTSVAAAAHHQDNYTTPRGRDKHQVGDELDPEKTTPPEPRLRTESPTYSYHDFWRNQDVIANRGAPSSTWRTSPDRRLEDGKPPNQPRRRQLSGPVDPIGPSKFGSEKRRTASVGAFAGPSGAARAPLSSDDAAASEEAAATIPYTGPRLPSDQGAALRLLSDHNSGSESEKPWEQWSDAERQTRAVEQLVQSSSEGLSDPSSHSNKAGMVKNTPKSVVKPRMTLRTKSEPRGGSLRDRPAKRDGPGNDDQGIFSARPTPQKRHKVGGRPHCDTDINLGDAVYLIAQRLENGDSSKQLTAYVQEVLPEGRFRVTTAEGKPFIIAAEQLQKVDAPATLAVKKALDLLPGGNKPAEGEASHPVVPAPAPEPPVTTVQHKEKPEVTGGKFKFFPKTDSRQLRVGAQEFFPQGQNAAPAQDPKSWWMNASAPAFVPAGKQEGLQQADQRHASYQEQYGGDQPQRYANVSAIFPMAARLPAGGDVAGWPPGEHDDASCWQLPYGTAESCAAASGTLSGQAAGEDGGVPSFADASGEVYFGDAAVTQRRLQEQGYQLQRRTSTGQYVDPSTRSDPVGSQIAKPSPRPISLLALAPGLEGSESAHADCATAGMSVHVAASRRQSDPPVTGGEFDAASSSVATGSQQFEANSTFLAQQQHPSELPPWCNAAAHFVPDMGQCFHLAPPGNNGCAMVTSHAAVSLQADASHYGPVTPDTGSSTHGGQSAQYLQPQFVDGGTGSAWVAATLPSMVPGQPAGACAPPGIALTPPGMALGASCAGTTQPTCMVIGCGSPAQSAPSPTAAVLGVVPVSPMAFCCPENGSASPVQQLPPNAPAGFALSPAHYMNIQNLL